MVMGGCLILLGYIIGNVYAPGEGGIAGIIIALSVWIILSLVSYSSGDSILLSMSRAKKVSHDVHPQLFNIVEEMKIAANLPVIPAVYIIDDAAPNAFATGIKPERTAIAVTAGLLSRLNRDELQGVVAHEMSHIMNRDVLFMTFSGILLGSIVIISEIFLRSMFYSSMSSRRYRSGSRQSAGQAQVILIVVAVILAILAPIMARLLYFAISRKREYLADASAVRLTRYPEGLASALNKISNVKLDLASASKVTAPMYIVNPLKKKGVKLSDLTSTHPPISERIKILKNMMGGVNYSNYQKAFQNVKGMTDTVIPASALKESDTVSIRKAHKDEDKKYGKKKEARDLGDLMRAVNNYTFLTCVCGLKIKVPPKFKKPKIDCPRCARHIDMPIAGLAVAAALKDAGIKNPDEQVYRRTGSGWESFSCSCGRLLQISPSFRSSHIVCKACGKKNRVISK